MNILSLQKLLTCLFSLVLLVLAGCASSVNLEQEADNDTANSTVEANETEIEAEIDTDIAESTISESTSESTTAEVNEPEATFPPPEEDIEYGNFSEDILTRVILAEMAGQRGLNQNALDSYLDLARDTGDINIIKRASRIASFSRNTAAAIEMGNMWLELEPDSPAALQTIAIQMITLGRYGQALDHFAHLLELGREVDFRLITSRTATDSATGLIMGALIADFLELEQQHPDNYSLRLALATLYQQDEQVSQAYEVVSQLALDMNDAPELVILEIQMLELMGETERAKQRLQESLDTNPDHKQLRLEYGRKLVDEQRYSEAMEQFKIIVDQDPEDWDMLFYLARLSLEVNRLNDSQRYFERLIENSRRLNDSHFYLAFISSQENDADRALEHYLQVEAGNNFLPAQRFITEIMVEQGHYSEASARLQNIRFRNADYNIELLTMEANVLLDQGLQDEASTFLNSAVGAFPNNIQLLFQRSVLSGDLNDLVLMEQDLRKIIRLNPNNPSAYNSLGYTLADRTDRIDEAYELIQQAIVLAPNDPAIIDSLGWVQYRLGLYEEARENLDRAFELFPDHEVAAHLGEVMWVLGNKRAANRIWEDALEVQPDSKFILEAMDRLTSDPSS